MFQEDNAYYHFEALLFKLILPTYDQDKMEDHKFADDLQNDEDWKLID